MKRPSLLLADDHTLVLDGLSRILESEFDLLGTVDNGRDLLEKAQELRPDIILLDISMPLLNGIDAARQLKKTLPGAKLIFLTMHSDAEYVSEAFRAGASGYLLKRCAASEMVTAIHEVMKDRFYMTSLITREALGPMISNSPDAGKVSVKLTIRQREVLQLVAEGHSIKQIASILKVSVKTIDFHKASIAEKLGMRTTAELTRYAIDHGLIG